MSIKRKLTTFMLAFVVMVSLFMTLSAEAATTDYKIISDTKVTVKQAKNWAKSKGATDTFISLADLYFKYAEDHGGVNPAIAYVQAAKETGYGKFGGVLDESYHNPCGLKTSSGGGDTDPNAHNKFDSWDEGVQAHLDHLALYAGASGYPRSDTYDPRHFVTVKGTAKTVNSLGGKWAPSATYGKEIAALYENLMDYSGVDYEKNNNTSNNSNNKPTNSNAKPNPGTPENKPSDLSPEGVITENKVEDTEKTEDNTITITSTVGWKNENNNWYYYKSDNTKAIGWIKPDSNSYYLDENTGKMQTGWLKYNGNWYYLDASGAMAKGWRQINNNWYFLKETGVMATGFQFDGKNLYYLKSSGEMEYYNGWTKLDNNWYYFEKTGKVKTGWYKEKGVWYYLQGDGTMVTGLRNIDNTTYMFNSSGDMATGWIKINNNWYYFNGSGSMATGWILDGGTYYYLYDNGAMATGWLNINETWYYLNASGAMQTGWVTSNGDYYYLDKVTGRLLTNTKIDGYTIGSDGKRQTSNDDTDIDKDSDSGNSNNSSNNNSSKGKTIVIDPGHDYGKDYGAETTINGVTYSETVLNMEVADKLRKELEDMGYNVIMTRTIDEKPSYGSLNASLTHRVNVANSINADFFISIHHNSAGESAKGVLTLYSDRAQDTSFGGSYNSSKIQESKQMATLINNNIVNEIGAYNRGGQEQNLFVCRNTNMPAVLVEVGFITNEEEAKRCANSDSQEKVAKAIAEVIGNNI